MSRSESGEHRIRLIIAFACVYLIWGSTYLAIRYAIQTIPPFLMAGVRFLVAGVVLAAWSRSRGAAWPTRREWRVAAIVGALLLVGGNGGVVWAEQTVPSSLAALIVAAVPIVTVALDWIRPGGVRPAGITILGLLTGFTGVAILVNPFATDVGRVNPLGAASLLLATVTWAAGSLYSRAKGSSLTPLMGAGANMISGGLGLLVLGAVAGELPKVNLGAISLRSGIALAYLIVIGALVGFTAFFWILRNTTPAKSTTYAYVNPVVAIILGWAIAGEPITPRVLVAAAIIITGVVMITTLPHLKRWMADRQLQPTAAS